MLSTPALAQVGGEPSQPETGIVARWDGPMPLDAGAALELPPAAEGAKLEDFSVCFALWMRDFPRGDHAQELLSLAAEGKGQLHFDARAGGGLLLRREWKLAAADDWSTLPEMKDTGRWMHVALVVNRDARQPLSGLWLDGIEWRSWREPPGGLLLRNAEFILPGMVSDGQIANLRLYQRALNRAEVVELASRMPAQAMPPKLPPFLQPPKAPGFVKGEVIAVLGGTEAVAVMEEGSLEAMLVEALPHRGITMRDLTWEADTVFRQDRPQNFGTLRQQLERAKASCMLLMFGRQECLEGGAAGLDRFRSGLEQLLRDCGGVTQRLIVLAPPPFEGELARHNDTLKRYSAVMAEVALASGAWFGPWRGDGGGSLTRDGLNLTETGARLFATQASKLMGMQVTTGDAALRKLVREKNLLWHRCWRPANWAFLHGDRTAQPSSRDHEDPTRRWFPGEVEQYRPLIEAKEQEIWQRADELGGKLP